MDLKALYQRFRAWQKEPFKYKKPEGEAHLCANCGTTFEGAYCPVCGQKASDGPVTWKSVDKDLKSLLKIKDPGALIPFILQLFGRTGYMIGDYIQGRRKVCDSPVGKLCIIAMAALLVQGLTGKSVSEDPITIGGMFGFLEKGLQWLSNNLSWAILIQTALLVIPTWMLFRHAPKHPKHSLPEGIYIQVFMSSLVLFFVMLRYLLGNWILIFIPVFYFIAYYRLFGYGIWGTLWRTVLSIGFVFYLFGVLMWAGKHLLGDSPLVKSTGWAIVIVAALLLAGVGILFLGKWIDKKTSKSTV